MSAESPKDYPEKWFEMNEPVKVQRSSGEKEEGWSVVLAIPAGSDPSTRVLVAKGEMTKRVTLADLREWNNE